MWAAPLVFVWAMGLCPPPMAWARLGQTGALDRDDSLDALYGP